MRIAFAGDRDLAVWVLEYLLVRDVKPLALLTSSPGRASHADELRSLCAYLDDDHILVGNDFREEVGIALLGRLELDYIVGVHFPYIVPETVLTIPTIGVLNLHPAYLPYNRGWHTPSWGILEGTPVGATLHFMDQGIDTGDIIHRKRIEVSPGETAHSLYQKLKKLELVTFKEAWPSIEQGDYTRQRQDPEAGTIHKRSDLYSPEIQEIDLDEPLEPRLLLKQLRALTTDRVDEAAYFTINGKRYRVQVKITESNSTMD